MGLGDPGLFLNRAGADMGLEGRLNGPRLKKVLVGLAEWQLNSPLHTPSFFACSPSPSRNGMAKELKSGMFIRSDLLFLEFFFSSFFLESIAVPISQNNVLFFGKGLFIIGNEN